MIGVIDIIDRGYTLKEAMEILDERDYPIANMQNVWVGTDPKNPNRKRIFMMSSDEIKYYNQDFNMN